MEVLLLCIKIFFVRIIDVSLGTFRTMNMVKGKPNIASIIGFVEVLIWFLVVKEALNTSSNSIFIAISYAAGYATGTFIGGKLSEKFIEGTLTVQVITTMGEIISSTIRSLGHAVSVIEIKGMEETKKEMLYISIDKNHLSDIEKVIKELDKQAFIVVNELTYVKNGYFKNQIVK